MTKTHGRTSHLAMWPLHGGEPTRRSMNQRALDLNPNFAAAHGYLGLALALDGRSDQAIAHGDQAIRMSPHDPQNAVFNLTLAAAHYLAGRYNEAIVYGRKAMQQDR